MHCVLNCCLLGPLVLDDEDEEGDELTLQTPSQDHSISPTSATQQYYPSTTFTTTTTTCTHTTYTT